MYKEKPWILNNKSKNKTKKVKKDQSRTKERTIEKACIEAIQKYKKEVLKMKSFKIFGWEISIRRR